LQNILLYSFYFPNETIGILKQANFLHIFVSDSIKLSPQFMKYSIYNKKVFINSYYAINRFVNKGLFPRSAWIHEIFPFILFGFPCF